MREVQAVACQHIADYYEHKWREHHCIAWNLLRRGYKQASHGLIEVYNNLFDWK